MPQFRLTAEQEAIIRAAKETTASLMVEADAGCSKSTTLELLSKELSPKPTLALAFNKKIAVELEQRLPKYFTIKTMNGLGHGAWAKATGKRLELVTGKMGKVVSQVLKDAGHEGPRGDWAEVLEWADAARAAGLVYSQWAEQWPGLVPDTKESWDNLVEQPEPREDFREFAREALRRSTEEAFAGRVDFDDQIYCSVMLGGVFQRYAQVMVDEAQDLSPMNHRMVERSLTTTGRLFVLGDSKQAIYAFRGADSRSMQKLRELRADWLDLPLHTTFRCSKIVVQRQLWHAPAFRAWEGCQEGEFISWRKKGKEEEGEPKLIEWEGTKAEGWSWNWLRGLERGAKPEIFIMCRNVAPVMSMAFKLIRRGVGPVVLGKDIGKGLEALSRKIAPEDGTPAELLGPKIEAWMQGEIWKAERGEKEWLVDGIRDKGEALLSVLDQDGVTCAGDLRRAIYRLFAAEHGQVTLGTGHRVKGLECNVGLHLDPWRLPSKWALKAQAQGDESQMEQEWNLKYVMETRVRRVLIEADLRDFV